MADDPRPLFIPTFIFGELPSNLPHPSHVLPAEATQRLPDPLPLDIARIYDQSVLAAQDYHLAEATGGSAGQESLVGGEGDDLLLGQEGADLLIGGFGVAA